MREKGGCYRWFMYLRGAGNTSGSLGATGGSIWRRGDTTTRLLIRTLKEDMPSNFSFYCVIVRDPPRVACRGVADVQSK